MCDISFPCISSPLTPASKGGDASSRSIADTTLALPIDLLSKMLISVQIDVQFSKTAKGLGVRSVIQAVEYAHLRLTCIGTLYMHNP